MSRFYIQLSWRESSFRKQIIPAARRAKLFLSAKKTRTFEIFTQYIHAWTRSQRVSPNALIKLAKALLILFGLLLESRIKRMGCFSHSTVVRRRVRPRLVLCYNYTETGSLLCAVCVARIKTRTGCVIGRNGPQPRKSIQFNPSVAVGVISGAPTVTHSSLSLSPHIAISI
jgi:hypothetical protein